MHRYPFCNVLYVVLACVRAIIGKHKLLQWFTCFHGAGDGKFAPKPEQMKIANGTPLRLQQAHSDPAIADWDGDGDLDMVVGHSRSRCGDSGECLSPAVIGFYENTGISGNNWLQIKLVGGAGTNRWAIGAQVKAKADGFSQMQELSAGQGHYGNQNDRLLHFGLGSACTAEIEIRWPDLNLSKQTLTLQAGYRYEIVQGEAPQVLNP